jgi:hypothetical protein
MSNDPAAPAAPVVPETPAAPAAPVTPPVADPAAAGQPSGGEKPAVLPSGPVGYRPDGLPDHLAGKTEQETLDNVFKAYKGLRDAKLGDVPAKPDDYKIAWSEPLQAFAADLETDALMKGVKADAHEVGIGNAQLDGLLNKVFTRMIDMKLVETPVDTEAELAAITPAAARDLPPAEQEAARTRRLADNSAWLDGLAKDGLAPETVAQLKGELSGFAALHELLEFQRNGGVKPALNGDLAPPVTEATLQARIADPRNQFGNPKYETGFAAETSRMYQQFYGSAPKAG